MSEPATVHRAHVALIDGRQLDLDATYDDVRHAVHRDDGPISLRTITGDRVTFTAEQVLSVHELPVEPWPWV